MLNRSRLPNSFIVEGQIMAKKTGLTVEEIKSLLVSKGYVKDDYGHYKFTASNDKLYRFKFQKNSVRLEVQSVVPNETGAPVKFWVRLRTGTFRQMGINDKGEFTGMKR